LFGFFSFGAPVSPVSVVLSAPAEVKLVEATLKRRLVKEKPLRIIADRAYDSDPMRERMLEEEILLLAPHRRGRTKPSFNDGRWLRRYAKRWKSSASSPGCTTSEGSLLVGNIMPKTTSPSSNLDAQSFFSDIYEMAWLC
jgi:hypothetical protein